MIYIFIFTFLIAGYYGITLSQKHLTNQYRMHLTIALYIPTLVTSYILFGFDFVTIIIAINLGVIIWLVKVMLETRQLLKETYLHHMQINEEEFVIQFIKANYPDVNVDKLIQQFHEEANIT